MRSFTIVKINSSDRRVKSKSVGGRFQSSSPASAAKKAGSSVCRLNNINSSIKFKIAIRETTQGSSHKIFAYNFLRVRNPITVMRSGKPITYEFETKVKSLKRSARHDGMDLMDVALDAVGMFDDETPPVTRGSGIIYDPRSTDYKEYKDKRGDDEDDDDCNDDLERDEDEKDYITNLLNRKNDLFEEEKKLLKNRVDILRNCIRKKRIIEQQQLLDEIGMLNELNEQQQNEMDNMNVLLKESKLELIELNKERLDLKDRLDKAYDEIIESENDLSEKKREIKELQNKIDEMKRVERPEKIDDFDIEKSEEELKIKKKELATLLSNLKKEGRKADISNDIKRFERMIKESGQDLDKINEEVNKLSNPKNGRVDMKKISGLPMRAKEIRSELKELNNQKNLFIIELEKIDDEYRDEYPDDFESDSSAEEDGRRRRRKSAKKSVKKTKKSMKASRKSKRKSKSRRKNSKRKSKSRRKNSRRRM